MNCRISMVKTEVHELVHVIESYLFEVLAPSTCPANPPVVHKCSCPLLRDRMSPNPCACASKFDAQSTRQAFSKLVIIDGNCDTGATGPRHLYAIGSIAVETTRTIYISIYTIVSALQQERRVGYRLLLQRQN